MPTDFFPRVACLFFVTEIDRVLFFNQSIEEVVKGLPFGGIVFLPPVWIHVTYARLAAAVASLYCSTFTIGSCIRLVVVYVCVYACTYGK